MTLPPVLFVHVGPSRHGVTRYGTRLARAGAATTSAQRVRLPDATAVDELSRACRASRPAVCHHHFTDQLFASDPMVAAARFRLLADVGAPAISVVTLHDVPPALDPAHERRRAAYRAVIERADAVIVSSWHEAARVRDLADIDPTVISHYVEARQLCRSVARRPSVGVLGYLYPGKGHEAVVAATGRWRDVGVVAIGGPAPRHGALVDELRQTARSVDVPLQIMGWVGEGRLDACLGGTAVAVVANEDISASGSLATWLGAHRRPLVRSGPYADELAALAPGCLTLYDADDPEALPAAIGTALRTPSSTWQDRVPDDLRPARIAHRHLSLFARLA